jgi:DeoR/GlpR family transcriptional regulator of sugar metabolism
MRGKRAMMASAKRRILLVDHTKFDKVALHSLAHLKDFDLVIVDDKVGERQLEELRENDVPFEVASV